MTEGVDYDFPPNPNGKQLQDAGKHFAGRYVGPGTSDKQLTAAERDDLFAHGVDIFLLAEGAATGAQGGRTVGRKHAQMALDHARSLGAPDSAAIYFAIDYDLTTSDWPTAADYLRGAGDVLGVGRVGVYGEHDVMVWAQRDGVASWFFQTYAWSHGQWFAGNHIEQYLNGQTLPGGGGVDLCRAKQSNFGQWAARPAQGQEDDMPTYGVLPPPDGTVYEIAPGLAPRALTKPDWDLAQRLYPASNAAHPVSVTHDEIARLTAVAQGQGDGGVPPHTHEQPGTTGPVAG